MKNISRKIGLTLLFALLLNVSTVFAQEQESSLFKLKAFGIDTVAGYSAHIYASRTISNKTVLFSVQKPDGTNLSIPVVSDDSGIAEFDLYDFHTKQAGTYTISAKLEGGKDGDLNTFKVFPDEVSDMISTIESTSLIANADGKDKIYITITLTDKYNNPISNHSVELISSRSKDNIQKVTTNGITDKNGKMIFAVSSIEKGISIYSFLDTTTNIVLTKRLQIAFTDIKDAGGFVEKAYAAAGEVSKLTFENIPNQILPNSDVSFKLTAYDSEDAVVPNYAGTVHFSAEGSNSVYAQLPNDYTFDVDLDGGSHVFSGPSSINFSQAGTYKIVATDLNDFTIRGEVELVVGTGGSTSQTQHGTQTSTSDLVITSPTAGTYSDKQLSITGTAPASAVTIQVFDNDQNLGTTSVQADKTFTYQPSNLEDGSHKIFVVALDTEGTILTTSEEVQITIDTTPPEVKDIKFTPSTGIKTGDVIDIEVTSESDVFQGAVVFNVDIAELQKDPNEPTHYLASIQTPAEAGTYPIDVILVDELGNEGSYEDVAKVEVSANGDTSITGTEIPPTEEQPPVEENPPVVTDEKPGDVFGVRAVTSDKKVTLTWQASTDDKGVKNYKIYYGLTPTNLNMTVETKDSAVTWYVPNLQNGNEYFFAVAAIDTTGQESANKSTIVSGIPFSSEPVVYTPPEEETPQTEQVRPTAPIMQSTGPEIIWFVLGSIFISQVYFKFRRKVW